MVNAERLRLNEADTGGVPWRRWGPYLSERQWGTVREDYGSGDDTWSYVKECYFYLDATPTSSYLKMLYKYPQAEFPYADLIAVNVARGKSDPEFELLDTGIFDENRYFDVVIEYAKATPEDLLMQVTVHNRGLEDAELNVPPTLWFRHTWSWAGGAERPSLRVVPGLRGVSAVRAEHSELGNRWLYADQAVPVLVTGNETGADAGRGGIPRVVRHPLGVTVARWHAEHPYVIKVGDQEYCVGYSPAESDTGMFGGNSNWRGPVWFPINVMQSDPNWRDLVLFYEYFRGDNGAGIGASHQTGWTGTTALLPLLFRGISAEGLRTGGRGAIKSAAAGRQTGAAR